MSFGLEWIRLYYFHYQKRTTHEYTHAQYFVWRIRRRRKWRRKKTFSISLLDDVQTSITLCRANKVIVVSKNGWKNKERHKVWNGWRRKFWQMPIDERQTDERTNGQEHARQTDIDSHSQSYRHSPIDISPSSIYILKSNRPIEKKRVESLRLSNVQHAMFVLVFRKMNELYHSLFERSKQINVWITCVYSRWLSIVRIIYQST